MRRELNPPEPITTHRHGPSVRRGAKASRAFVVGRGVDDFDKQIASVGAAASSSRWARVAFNRMEPQMGTPTPQFDFSLMVAPSAVLELQREERCADSIASMRDSSKATPQLFVSAALTDTREPPRCRGRRLTRRSSGECHAVSRNYSGCIAAVALAPPLRRPESQRPLHRRPLRSQKARRGSP
jgi:hypothetical protein